LKPAAATGQHRKAALYPEVTEKEADAPNAVEDRFRGKRKSPRSGKKSDWEKGSNPFPNPILIRNP